MIDSTSQQKTPPTIVHALRFSFLPITIQYYPTLSTPFDLLSFSALVFFIFVIFVEFFWSIESSADSQWWRRSSSIHLRHEFRQTIDIGLYWVRSQIFNFSFVFWLNVGDINNLGALGCFCCRLCNRILKSVFRFLNGVYVNSDFVDFDSIKHFNMIVLCN